jgi:hypothetical protein
MTPVSRIKIYGERNTGTNYLTQLLKNHLSVEVLLGDAPRTLRWRIARRLPLSKTVRATAWLWEERFEEHWLERNFETHLGWKHMRIDVERLARLTTPDLGILLLIKHP